MSHWRAGQRITVAKLAVDTAQVEDTTSRTTTTTASYGNTTTGGAFSTTVTVPASGQVIVSIRSTQRNSGATNTITSWNASGSTSGSVYTANDNAALIVTGTSNISVDLTHRLTGLTPGETLTVTMVHKVSGGTGTFDYRNILLQGCP
ncbi:hypothetical protein ACFWIB_15175 [Streptomyces sp. NPDC127051]|uniref:hypothetical protein n=1 Tax=Streptomyces sp. NPDC127051 TaxID=3347119 RepID=UPI00365F0534